MLLLYSRPHTFLQARKRSCRSAHDEGQRYSACMQSLSPFYCSIPAPSPFENPAVSFASALTVPLFAREYNCSIKISLDFEINSPYLARYLKVNKTKLFYCCHFLYSSLFIYMFMDFCGLIEGVIKAVWRRIDARLRRRFSRCVLGADEGWRSREIRRVRVKRRCVCVCVLST